MKKIHNLRFSGLVCILVLTLIIIGFEFLQAQARAMAKPPSTSPLLPALMTGDIITTESDALKVWRYSFSDPIWTKKTESNYYSQVAVGDVNSDGKSEIVVPVSKENRPKGSGFRFKIFVDVYKEGSGIPISSENYSPGYFTDDSRVIADIAIANVIPEAENHPTINEIVLLHWYNLVIFQWDGTNFRIVKRIQARYTDLPLLCYFSGTTTKDIDGDGTEEVFISGQNTYYGANFPNYIGYVYVIDLDNPAGSLQLGSTKDGGFPNGVGLGYSLSVANLDSDADLEICLPGLLENRPADVSYWKAYLLVLDKNQEGNWQWNSAIIPGYELEKNVYPYMGLDVGKLYQEGTGDEIALYVNQQQVSDFYLYIFTYPFNKICEYRLQGADRIYDIKIGNICLENKIVVGGAAPALDRKNLRKYFEVFSYPCASFWQVFSESGIINDLAIVK